MLKIRSICGPFLTKNNYIYDINTITNPYFTRMKNGITSNNSYSLIVGLSVSMT